MHESRPQLALYFLVAVAVLLLGARALRDGAAEGSAGRTGPRPAPVRILPAVGREAVVHVAGAVRRGGVYRLRPGARVQDAIRRAGGARRGADLDAINLAARVADGQQVVVPARVSVPGSQPAGAASDAASAARLAGPVNLNTATAAQLDELDGVGPATAQKILAWRQQHGGFRTVDDLAQVPGIGPKRLAALRPHVSA